MDTPKVSQMWKLLQETNKLPQSQLFTGAEEELQELMRQIDIMVQNRKADWEREKQALLARIDIKEKEHIMQSSTLDEKHKEIGHLRAQLETVEQSHRNATAEYERTLTGLREQIAEMKKEFEKLHRRYSKKAKQAEAVQQRTNKESHGNSEELKRLSAKLEEFRKRAKDWEQRRRSYEEQIELLQKQMRLLQDRQQDKTSRSDPSSSTDETKRLMINNERLQTSLSEREKLVMKLQSELEQLRSENEMTQQIIVDQRKLISKLEGNVKQNTAAARKGQNDDISQKEEIKMLRKQNSDLLKEKQDLTTELQNKLKAGQDTMDEVHKEEVNGLKQEVAALTVELHEKVTTTAKLHEQLSASEKKLSECGQLLDRTQAELQVALAQRDALRLENQNLRHIALSKDGLDVNVTEVEYHLKELQKAYGTSVTSLEAQNRKLQLEINTLKGRLSALEENNVERSQQILNESQRSLQDLQDAGQKKILELEKRYKREMQNIQEKLNITVQQYENQIEVLRLEMTSMQEELELQNNSMKGFGMDHRLMTRFVDAADQWPRPASRHSNNSSNGSRGNTDDGNAKGQSNDVRNSSVEFEDELDEDFLTDTVEAARDKFLQDQNARTQQLVEQLDTHIHYLKESTNETIRKHSIKSH